MRAGGILITSSKSKDLQEVDREKSEADIEPEYLVLGGGTMGFAIAKALSSKGKVLIVDKDPTKVNTFVEQDLDALLGDFTDEQVLKKIKMGRVQAVLITTSQGSVNKKALSTISQIAPHVYVVCRAENVQNKETLKDMGANLVLVPHLEIADVVTHSLEKEEAHTKAKLLLEVLEGARGKKLGIIVHDNPDPDAISSALALQKIAASVDIESTIMYHGEIGHQENKALVNLLGIELEKIEEHELTEFSMLALVDCTRPGVNNVMPEDTHISIVVDHHCLEGELNAEFSDIRPNAGSTATIMAEYFWELGLPMDEALATALLYGIRTDTKDFKKQTTPEDFKAAAYIYPYAEHEVLSQIENPSISSETLDAIATAIFNKKIRGSYLISNVGVIKDRDVIPQAVENLLRLEGILTALVFGITDEVIYISARTKDIRLNLGEIMKRAYGKNAGGHSTAAGAQIALGLFKDIKEKNTLIKLVDEVITRKFLEAMGLEEKPQPITNNENGYEATNHEEETNGNGSSEKR
ncbi:MAG: DHH family phosphoesterase [Methermicoccaceae archaeon]